MPPSPDSAPMPPSGHRVTMAQIAAKAGVHTTTVSLALRNHPSLPDATRQRIQELAARMGYTPDPALRALVAHRRGVTGIGGGRTLAYLTNWDSPWAWKGAVAHLKFFEGAQAAAKRLGYQLEHFWQGEPHLRDHRLSDILQARGIQGLIVASQSHENDRRLGLDWDRFCAVKIDLFPHEPRIDIVTNDQRNILRTAFHRVRAHGYRRIGFAVRKVWDECSDECWSSGFLGVQQFLPEAERIPLLFLDSPTDNASHDITTRQLGPWLAQHKPDALIGYEATLLPALRQLGLAVPADLGFADICLHRQDGQTAGVFEHCDKVCERAVELLSGKLDLNLRGIPTTHCITNVDGTWCDGASLPRRNT